MIAEELAEQVLAACRARGLKLATVESCTGGLIGAALTDIPGSSDVVECGFITYANSAKTRLVGVSEALLARYGAVSEQVARAMAEGGVKAGNVDIAVAVSGIAGPGGDTAEKPVGLVHLAVAMRGSSAAAKAANLAPSGNKTAALPPQTAAAPIAVLHYEARFGDIGRQAIRLATVKKALELILEIVQH